MILSFGDAATEDFFNGENTPRARRFPADIRKRAFRKLDMLNAAADVKDLSSPPGNRLESLTGNLQDYYSIRVNDQWRIIFRWQNGNAYDVELVDYH